MTEVHNVFTEHNNRKKACKLSGFDFQTGEGIVDRFGIRPFKSNSILPAGTPEKNKGAIRR